MVRRPGADARPIGAPSPSRAPRGPTPRCRTASTASPARCAATASATATGSAFLGLNQPAFFVTLFAAARLGAIFVPLNFRLTGPELTYIDQRRRHPHARRRRGPPRRHRRHPRRPALPPLLVGRRSAVEGWPSFEHVRDRPPAAGRTASRSTPTRSPSSCTRRARRAGPRAPCSPTATSGGTTSNALTVFDVAEDDVSLVMAPLFHIGGLNVITLVTWMKGGEVRAAPHVRPGHVPATTSPAIGVTTTFGVPGHAAVRQPAPRLRRRRPHARCGSSSAAARRCPSR